MLFGKRTIDFLIWKNRIRKIDLFIYFVWTGKLKECRRTRAHCSVRIVQNCRPKNWSGSIEINDGRYAFQSNFNTTYVWSIESFLIAKMSPFVNFLWSQNSLRNRYFEILTKKWCCFKRTLKIRIFFKSDDRKLNGNDILLHYWFVLCTVTVCSYLKILDYCKILQSLMVQHARKLI
jgi:hypothetical protein